MSEPLPQILPVFHFGDRVLFYVSKKDAEPQQGVITFAFINGHFDYCYHVRDIMGNYWHREARELKKVVEDVSAN